LKIDSHDALKHSFPQSPLIDVGSHLRVNPVGFNARVNG
jgi:hypothetical protein